MVIKTGTAENVDWLVTVKNNRIGSYARIKDFVVGWSNANKRLFYNALSARGIDVPDVRKEKLDEVLEIMIAIGDLPSSLQTSQKHLSGRHVQQTHGKGGGFSSRSERVWTGKRDEKGNLSKLQTGEIGERLAMHALSEKFGKLFDTLNVGVNNAPIDVISLDGKIAVEVKAGLTSNSSSARRWRATIGEPGKSEKAAIKRMTPAEKKEHNSWKREKILERKSSMLKKMSDELGVEIKPFVTGVIMSPDGKAGDVFLIPGFHLTASWSKFATDEFHIGSFNIGDVAEKLKHLPGQHQQLSHGGKRGLGSPVPVDKENEKLVNFFGPFAGGDISKTKEIVSAANKRLTDVYRKQGLVSISDKTMSRIKKTGDDKRKNGASEQEIADYTTRQLDRGGISSSYLSGWSMSSTNEGGFQDALQLEAFERQGGRDYAGLDRVSTKRSGMSGKHRRVTYDNIKDSTQDWFKEQGFKPDDEISIYRGMSTSDVFEKGSILKKDSMTHNPLSSWSFNRNVAESFANAEEFKNGTTFAATVKVKDIFSTAGIGFGTFREAEVVMESSKIGDLLIVEIDPAL